MGNEIAKNLTMLPITQIELNEGQLEGLPKNPRTISKKKFEKLKHNIEAYPEMLAWRSILVYPLDNGHYIIIGGNMRLRAMQELGHKEVPCVIIPKETTVEQLQAYTIIDNNGFGEWDWDLLANEWDVDLLNDWGFDFPSDDIFNTDEASEDDFNEEEDKDLIICRCKKGEIWQCGEHRVMCGDSTQEADVKRLMGGVKADLCFTDPPYNCDYGNIKHQVKARPIQNDNMDEQHFHDFCVDFICNIKEFTKGCVYMCAGQGKDGRIMFIVADQILHNSTTIIWNKDQFTLGRGKYQNKYEPIWFGWNESGVDFTDDRTLTNVWDIARPKKSELHPTMKPLELCATALKHNPKSHSVLDLFGGSGTTLIACEQLGRKCYMMELDPHYCDVILARWEKHTGQTAIKIEDPI